jgi:hypothetical protein
MKYNSIVVTGLGSSDVLKITENDLRAPAACSASNSR